MVCQVGMMWRVGCAAGQVTAKRCHYEGYLWSGRRSPGSRGCERVRSTSPIPCRVSMWSACPEPSRSMVLRRRDSQRVASYFNLSKRPIYGAQVGRAILGYGRTARSSSRPRCSDWPNLYRVLCHLREAPTEEAIRQAGHDLLRYLVKNHDVPVCGNSAAAPSVPQPGKRL